MDNQEINSSSNHHHQFELSPILVGLLGVLAGTIIVAICHCIIMLCSGDNQRRRFDDNPTAAVEVAVAVESKYGKEHKQEVCSICLGEFKQEESVRILPECAHIFHVACINKWLHHHPNCPLCRATAVTPPPVIDRVSEVGGVVV